MAQITVIPVNINLFEVTVDDRISTRHTVTLNNVDYLRLTGKQVSPSTLIEKSFEFLLERESNSSILRQFDLSVISRYFPDFEKIIATRLNP